MHGFVFTFVHMCGVTHDPTLINAWSAQATLRWSMSVEISVDISAEISLIASKRLY